MIRQTTLVSIYNEAVTDFLTYRIAEGLELLTALMLECDDQQLARQTNQLYDDYIQMLRFLANGGKDTLHASIQSDITYKGLIILQKAHRSIRILHRLDMYGQTYQQLQQEYGKDPQEALLRQWEELKDTPMRFTPMDALFEYLWTSPTFTSQDTNFWLDFISRQPVNCQRFLITALALSLQEYFDKEKVQLLLRFSSVSEVKIRAYAITGYAFFILKFQKWETLFNLEKLDCPFTDEMFWVQKYFILSMRSEEAINRIDTPSLARYRKLLMGIDELPLPDMIEGMEENRKIIQKAALLTQMGYDQNTRYAPFLNSISFFKRIAHWFAPFETDRPEVISSISDKQGDPKKIAQLILTAGDHCETDRYGLCMFLFNQKHTHWDDALNEGLGDFSPRDFQTTRSIYQNIIRVYFRFFQVSPWKSDFVNPFQTITSLYDCNALASYLTDEQHIQICKLLIWEENYSRPLIRLDNLMFHQGASTELLFLKGICHQFQANYKAALEAFRQAEILDSENVNLLDNMQHCYQELQDYRGQQDILQRLIQLRPWDVENYESQLANCYIHQGQYADALNTYYQMEFTQGERRNLSRSIAWCCFKLNKLENAEKYYRQLIQDSSDADVWKDYINAGHVAWVMGDWQLAKQRYFRYQKLYMQEFPQDNRAGMMPFESDKKDLLEHGITIQDFYLMRDIILSHHALQ